MVGADDCISSVAFRLRRKGIHNDTCPKSSNGRYEKQPEAVDLGSARNPVRFPRGSGRAVSCEVFQKQVGGKIKKEEKLRSVRYCLEHHDYHDLIPHGRRVHHDGVADSLCLGVYGYRIRRSWS